MKLKYLFALMLCAACGPKKEASVSRAMESGPVKLPMALSSLTGKREGYKASGTVIFVDAGARDSLTIRFVLEPGVPTKFVRGGYRWKSLSGDVSCSSVDFFGGQGGVPSIGGNFEFTTQDGASYQVYLPTTEMKPDR